MPNVNLMKKWDHCCELEMGPLNEWVPTVIVMIDQWPTGQDVLRPGLSATGEPMFY